MAYPGFFKRQTMKGARLMFQTHCNELSAAQSAAALAVFRVVRGLYIDKSIPMDPLALLPRIPAKKVQEFTEKVLGELLPSMLKAHKDVSAPSFEVPAGMEEGECLVTPRVHWVGAMMYCLMLYGHSDVKAQNDIAQAIRMLMYKARDYNGNIEEDMVNQDALLATSEPGYPSCIRGQHSLFQQKSINVFGGVPPQWFPA